MSNSAIRYELLEELARLAFRCRHLMTDASPDVARFQEVIDQLSARPAAQTEDHLVSLLHAIRGGPELDRDSLYRQAASLIPV